MTYLANLKKWGGSSPLCPSLYAAPEMERFTAQTTVMATISPCFQVSYLIFMSKCYTFNYFAKCYIFNLHFTDQTNIINIKDLKSPITEGLKAMPGLTTPFLIMSSSGAAFPWHIEEQVSQSYYKLI